MKVESRQPAPSRSKDVLTSKEIPKKKKGAKLPEKPNRPAEDVVVLDDISSEEDGNGGSTKEGGAKEGGKKTGEKSLLDLLELEMRARAIRSLLKKEEETQAQRILSEYKDEPDDLIPVEIAPPQVDLLSDSDEESKLEEPTAQPSTSSCLQLEVEGDSLSQKDVGVLDSLLGIEKEESSDVVVVEDVSIDSTLVNPPVEPTVTNTIKQLETSKSDAVIVGDEDTVSLVSKDSGMDGDVPIKVEKDNDEPNQPCKIEHHAVRSTPSSFQHSCSIQTQKATVAKSSTKSNAVEMPTPKKSVTTQAEIEKLKDSSCKESCPQSGKGKSKLLVPGGKSSDQPDNDFGNTYVFIKEEPRSSEDDIVIAASKVGFEENDGNQSSKTPMNVKQISEGVDTKVASDGVREVSSVKSGGTSLLTDPSDSPVESSKPQSISAGYDYHSNFEEDILDYDYDPSLNVERQSWNSVAGGTSCPRSSPSSGNQREDVDHEDVLCKNNPGIEINPKKVAKIASLEAEIVKPSPINEKLISNIANRGCFVSLPEDNLNTSTSGGNPATADENISRHVDDVSSVKMPIPLENEEVPVSFSVNEDSDSIQPAELRILSQDKSGIMFSENKELRISQQCPSDSICNTLKENNFLAHDALGSPEAGSPKSTPKSQEHNEIRESLDLAEDQISKQGGQQVHGPINTTESASHKSEELTDNCMSKDGRESAKFDTIMQTPDVTKETLDLANHVDSNSILMVSDEVKNDDPSLNAKERQSPQGQCVGDYIANKSEEHDHFLANDALDSLEPTSPHPTIESQEHNETDLSISSQIDQENTTLDQDHHNKTPYSSDSQLTGRQEIVAGNAHLCSIEGVPSQIERCKEVLIESELCEFIQGSPVADSPTFVVDSQEHESNSSTNSQSQIEAVADVVEDHHHNISFENEQKKPLDHEFCDSSDVELLRKQQVCSSFRKNIVHSVTSPKTVTETQKQDSTYSVEDNRDGFLGEGSTPQLDSNSSVPVLFEGGQLDFSINNADDYCDTSNLPSPKKAILADEVVPVECKIAEGLSDNEEQHFLVDVALDSLDPKGSETKLVNREPNELSLAIKDDVSRKRASPVSNSRERPHTEGTRSGGTSRRTGTSSRNCEHFLGESFESDSSISNQGLLCSKVDNGKVVLGEKDDTVPVIRKQENTPHGMVESDFVDQEAQSYRCVTLINLESQGQDELSLGGTNVRCCSESETTAFVGCNSIEIQKTIQITNGQAVRQTVLLSGTSHESLNMDCIVVSSEEEDELNEVSSNQQYLDELIGCSPKNIPCTLNPSSPVCDYSQISSHSGLLTHSIHQYSLGNKSSSCDILISSDEHTFHGEKSKFMEKIISNEGDPCPKSAPCSRTMESNFEATEPSLTVLEQRGNHEELNEIDKEVAVGDEKQTPHEAHGLEKTPSSHGAQCPSSVSSKTEPFSLQLMESYLVEEATTGNGLRIGTYGYSKAVKSSKPPSCKINHDKPTLHRTESLEVISSHHEPPYILSAMSSTSKASSLNTMQSSVVLEVRANKLGADKKDSEVIEIDDEDLSGSFSESPETTHESQRLVETQSSQGYSCVSLLVPVPATKALLFESSQLSLLKEKEVSAASRDVDHTSVGTTSQYGTPCPSAVTLTASCLEIVQSPLILKSSDQSGTGNYNSEVIEIFEDSAGRQ
uniref:Uncharacterized protein n=1 Tax=Lygus hesperus TaxID=30085 RepID=A0A0A9XYU4_LYGHE